MSYPLNNDGVSSRSAGHDRTQLEVNPQAKAINAIRFGGVLVLVRVTEELIKLERRGSCIRSMVRRPTTQTPIHGQRLKDIPLKKLLGVPQIRTALLDAQSVFPVITALATLGVQQYSTGI